MKYIFLLVVFSHFCSSQQSSPAPEAAQKLTSDHGRRPTIGLVLEGGGALGLAHVGVLTWFEQNHIPIDYLAGTSMGALVGGLYATGMSAEQVKNFLVNVDWNKALRDETPYYDLSFRRKEDKSDYPNNLEFGLKGGVSFPSGFDSGHEVGLILDRVALPYSDLKSFDELPTPFRCVATDLVSGQATVLDKGSLAEALRTTMSLPAIFSPVRRDGHVYVDGGLIKNLPVDVARAMGADIVIAVHLETKPLDATESLSAFSVLQRSISVVISVNELESMKRADVLIPVHTEAFTSTEYQSIKPIIDLGFSGAQERAQLLHGFALSDRDWDDYEARRARRKRSVPVPQFVEVAGAPPAIAVGIEKRLEGNVGKSIDYQRLDEDLTQITGMGRFSRAGFQLARKDGQDGLLVHAEEKDYAPPTVNPLFLIDGSDYTDVRFSLGSRLTLNDIGGFDSELRNDVIVGSSYGIASEYYHPLTWARHFFVAPRGFANSAPLDLYLNDKRTASYRRHDFGGGLDFGVAIDRFSELRFGYQAEYLSVTRNIGASLLPELGGRQGFARLRFVTDHTDNPTLPRQGYSVQTRMEFYEASPAARDHFPLAEVRTGIFQRTSKSSSLFLQASGGSTFGYRYTGLPPFSLGGPLRLASYGSNELLTNQYFLFQPGYIRALSELSPLLGDHVYLIAAYELGKAYGAANTTPPRISNDINGAILVQTFLGPIVFGGAVGDRGHHKFYFQLGRFF